MADWKDYVSGAAGVLTGGVGGVAVNKLLGGSWGNPMDWGKNPVDPNNASMQDGSYLRDYIRGQLGSVGGRQAPQIAGARIDGAQQAQWRQQQMSLAQQLAGVASGQQAGAGELATRRQFGQGLAAQLAQAQMSRGSNAALGARAAARGIGDMTVNAAGQSAQSAMGDQTQARGLLAGLIGQGREQDLGMAGQNAQMQQQANLANQAAKLQQLGMNDQQIAQMLAQMYNVNLAEMQAKLGLLINNSNQQGYIGPLLQQAGTLAAAAAGA